MTDKSIALCKCHVCVDTTHRNVSASESVWLADFCLLQHTRSFNPASLHKVVGRAFYNTDQTANANREIAGGRRRPGIGHFIESHRQMKQIAFALLLAFVVLARAGCGGGGDEPSKYVWPAHSH